MTSATTQPARGTGGHRAEGHGYGLVLFASVLLVIVGCFNLIYGIAAIANSHVFTANAHYVFGDLRTWGWITLIIGVLQLLAAAGVVAGNQLARWFAVAVLGLNAIDQMFLFPTLWTLTIAADVVALYLCAYGSRAPTAPERRRARTYRRVPSRRREGLRGRPSQGRKARQVWAWRSGTAGVRARMRQEVRGCLA
jgi:hypothetical protein